MVSCLTLSKSKRYCVIFLKGRKKVQLMISYTTAFLSVASMKHKWLTINNNMGEQSIKAFKETMQEGRAEMEKCLPYLSEWSNVWFISVQSKTQELIFMNGSLNGVINLESFLKL